MSEPGGSPGPNPVVVRAEGLSLARRRRLVLADVDLTVRRGELWFLVGPNGSGKTTFLEALLGSGLVRRGRLQVSPPRSRIGYVPQRCELNPTLPFSVREFVSLGLVGCAVDRRRRGHDLRWALDRVDLGGLESAAYASMSGGQRQRALVARALVRRPELLLLDEATNGLDLAAEHALLEAIVRLNQEEQVTVLCASHHLELASRHARFVALFHGGGIAAGPGESVLNSERLQEVYRVPGEVAARAAGEPRASLVVD